MQWVKLTSQHMKKMRYNAEKRQLDIRMANGKVVRHTGVMQHMFDNMTASPDMDFYYKYYIAPSALSRPVRHFPRTLHLLKAGALAAVVWLISAQSVLVVSNHEDARVNLSQAEAGLN